jgi:hypothetical protein
VPDRPDGVAKPLGATVAGLVLFAVGIVMGAGALEVDRKDRESRQTYAAGDGTVVAQIKRPAGGESAVAPIIAFATGSGERISFTGPVVDPSAYPLGTKVPVLYVPGNPADAKIDDTNRRRIRIVVAGAASILLMFLGGYVAWAARRAEAARAAASTNG